MIHIVRVGCVVGIRRQSHFGGLRVAGEHVSHTVVCVVIVLCTGCDGVVFVAPWATYFRSYIKLGIKFASSSGVFREGFTHSVDSGGLKVCGIGF